MRFGFIQGVATVADPRGGAIAPPSPLKLKIHSILCMGVLDDNTISTAVHQVVNYVQGRVFH